MKRIGFPYGISNFETLVKTGKHYVDRTMYLAKMEEMDTRYHFFLRPRRFGKSLAVSVMEYYYGKQHRAKFEELFGRYYIGQHPTAGANAYLVLKFDFSGIRTNDLKAIEESFAVRVREQLLRSLLHYRALFSEEDFEVIQSQNQANELLDKALTIITENNPGEKVFLLIDEYDHFTNEIIAFSFNDFRTIVSRNGIVRKFFEVVKEGTQSGVIDRIFATGVSPVTLDSLTSGFNIGTNLSLRPDMHDFMGFTEAEVAEILRLAEVSEGELERVLADVRAWYNGYRFHPKARERLYNPDMVLYFASNYRVLGQYPETLVDTNVVSDYGKLERTLRVGDEAMNAAVLEEVIEDGSVVSGVTTQFSFERDWTRQDFVSLLFYLGMLTVQEAIFDQWKFQMPNHVIGELYYKFFQQMLLRRSNLQRLDLRIPERMIALARDGDVEPLREAFQKVLSHLDNRDARQLDEKHLKTALIALMSPTGVYMVRSEQALGQGYPDILLLRRPPILEPKRQYVFELKYLKKGDASRLSEVVEEGRAQLRRYLSSPEVVAQGDFVAYLWVVVGYNIERVEEVK
ncbi:MAG: AAA family ATPase [Saprospiraceae bacterium]|nr:ATP-binding protein [Saprospiraceae bacterium]MDW8230373.1 AAA family ATPase [Saprospiraceae bacterium]